MQNSGASRREDVELCLNVTAYWLLASHFAFWSVFADDALVTLQSPIVIWPLGEPISNSNLRVYRTGTEGNARLITGGNDFLEAELAVAEDGDKSDEHGDLR